MNPIPGVWRIGSDKRPSVRRTTAAVSEAEAAVDPWRFLSITAVGVEKLSIISRERKPREDEKRL